MVCPLLKATYKSAFETKSSVSCLIKKLSLRYENEIPTTLIFYSSTFLRGKEGYT